MAAYRRQLFAYDPEIIHDMLMEHFVANKEDEPPADAETIKCNMHVGRGRWDGIRGEVTMKGDETISEDTTVK